MQEVVRLQLTARIPFSATLLKSCLVLWSVLLEMMFICVLSDVSE